jgi:hypothetical protein
MDEVMCRACHRHEEKNKVVKKKKINGRRRKEGQLTTHNLK